MKTAVGMKVGLKTAVCMKVGLQTAVVMKMVVHGRLDDENIDDTENNTGRGPATQLILASADHHTEEVVATIVFSFCSTCDAAASLSSCYCLIVESVYHSNHQFQVIKSLLKPLVANMGTSFIAQRNASLVDVR